MSLFMNQSRPDFLIEFEEKLKKIYTEFSLAYWNASIDGREDNWNKVAELQIELIKIFRNTEYFENIKSLYKNSVNFDSITRREIEVLYREFLPNQYDIKKLEEITNLQTKIENVFTSFRANYNGKSLTDNEIDEILKNETDSKVLKKVWESSKDIGNLLKDDLIKLVKLRNEQAIYLGFKNYHEMSLILSELNPDELDSLFHKLELETEKKYSEIKNKIDEDLSNRFNINKEDLMPWHYQQRFFQEAPPIFLVNLNEIYRNQDLVAITKDYFASIGLEIDDLIQKSDLFERAGKNQHAFCISIDKSTDIRVLCNVKSNVDWMGTLLHEYGHAVYDKYIDQSLPFVLRDAAHIFVTEAIAQLFGKLAVHPIWMKKILNIDGEEFHLIKNSTISYTKMNQLVFARWVMLMYQFEKRLYENPDDDLNDIWWELHKKYLHLNKPDRKDNPDWTTKIHIATSPCYYHNYLLGEIFSSQLNEYLHQNILKSTNLWENVLIDNPEIGNFLINKLFKYGASLHWKDVIGQSTGEDLNVEHYAKQYFL